MAILTGVITSLALSGVPGLATDWYDSATATTPRPYSADFTRLAVGATPGRPYGAFTGKTEVTLIDKPVSDTASLSVTEEPIDEQFIVASDTARLTLTEVTNLRNNIGVTDTASLSVSEGIALTIAGVTDKPVTDTASLTLTELTNLRVSLSVTDTTSLSVTESTSVATPATFQTVTDTASLTITDDVLLTVFAGLAAFNGADTASLRVTETATVTDVTAAAIAYGAITLSGPSIQVTLQ